jgi:Alpha/beta hydrolase family
MPAASAVLEQLTARFDPGAFDAPTGRARLRLEVEGEGGWDALVEGETLRLARADPERRANARLCADGSTWRAMARDVRGGMEAFRAGRLEIRDNLHLGVGFLAATSGVTEPGRLEFPRVPTSLRDIAVARAGEGDPVVMLHGLGATKASFLPTLAALAGSYRVLAIDLPGFGDSVKPLAAAYDPRFFAGAGGLPRRLRNRARAPDRQLHARAGGARGRLPPPRPRGTGRRPPLSPRRPGRLGGRGHRRVPARVPDPARARRFYAALRNI